ncbi:hypothetical protein F5876DRAFT_76462 [Lentinula aff. lateritia]|uniref:Uncharacterized protein n=1 Tax=Lentinula aff. lateritia TaxID=2804960 RepID=A0ACC1U157_9AGAR|nr:hypothetical protein F5876DRAFT_76462 [Lentinula aff. lateritia]
MEIGLANDSIWRISGEHFGFVYVPKHYEINPTGNSVLRSQNLHQLLHRRSSNNFNGWRPLVTISVDPHLGHNHCEIHETTLGSDGQNPNTKTGLDLESPRPNTKLLFEVVHFPQAAKKKARRLNKTVLGSCVYEMGELVRLAKEQERGSKQPISISLKPLGSGPRAKHMKRLRRDSTSTTTSDKGFSKIGFAGPSLQIKVIPPEGNPLTLARSSKYLGLSSCEEESEEDEDLTDENEETESLIMSLGSSKTLNDEGPHREPSPESGIRRRRRGRIRRRVFTGYACDSGDEIEDEEKWISESASETASEAEADVMLKEVDEYGSDSPNSNPNPSTEWSPWSWFDHVAPILGVLGMAQPNPGILPSYRDSLEDDHKHQAEMEMVEMEAHETDVDTGPIDEEEIWEWVWWERLLCLFTVYRELRIAEYEEARLGNSSLVDLGSSTSPRLSGASLSSLSAGLGDAEGSHFSMYDKIYQRLQVEWTYVGTLLLGLAAIDAAIFAISPSSSSPSFSDVASGAEAADMASSSSLFPVDSFAREAVSLSTISTALGLLCDAYFLMIYAWGDVSTFVNRARPSLPSSSHVNSSPFTPSSSPQIEQPTPPYHSSQSWGYFALSSRIPAMCTVLSIFFIGVFLLIVASEAAPPAGLWFLGVLVGMGMWMQYIVRFGKVVGRIIRGVGRGVRSGVTSVESSARWAGKKVGGLFVRSDDLNGMGAGHDVRAADPNTGKGKRSVIRPLPVKVRPEGRGRG